MGTLDLSESPIPPPPLSVLATISGANIGRFVLPTCEIGLVFISSYLFWWFPSPLECLLAGDSGMSTVEASSFLFSACHLPRPMRSACKKYVGATAGVLLFVPFSNFEASSGGWSALMRLYRPSATRATGRSLQGLECIFVFFQGCLCKH